MRAKDLKGVLCQLNPFLTMPILAVTMYSITRANGS